MQPYIIASFYRFCALPDYALLKAPLLAAMQTHQILGTIILAAEGINGGMAGLRANMDAFYVTLCADARFADISFKEMVDAEMPFEKAKVKLRKEVVSLGVPEVSPPAEAGQRLSPEAWNTLLQDPDVLVIDTRNDYEVALGRFHGAVDPQTENFRDFPAYVATNLLDKKQQKIAMYCTGGIRCEKSTAYLKMLGFREVYQLEGGILGYFKAIPPAASLWQGECFVFDERITVSHAHQYNDELPLDPKMPSVGHQ